MKIKFTTDFAGNWEAGEIVEAEFHPNGETLVDNVALVDTKLLLEHCVQLLNTTSEVDNGNDD